ncbi:MAG: tetratricopeptide repeat protein [Oscillospiraceae bacterium]|nr:tetratricopeptide repeat protein [Oscillospiraceae bacterium]
MKTALVLIAIVIIGFSVNKIAGGILLLCAVAYGIYAYIPTFYSYKGNVAFTKGDLTETRKWYEKAYCRKNASLNVKNAYAFVLLKCGEPKMAEDVLDLILMNQYVPLPKRNAARQTRCMAVYKQGRLDEAVEECEDLFENYKNTAMYGMLGYFKILQKRDPKEILDFCLEAYDFNSDDRDILDNLSIAYYNLGEYDKAREISDALLEKETEFVEGFYHRALIEEKCGNIKLAKEMAGEIKNCKRSYMTTISEDETEQLEKRLNEAAQS